MAEKRMFSRNIIDSDLFLEMPVSTQLLYFHLAMRADDDGFINSPKRISRTVGCSDDDLKLLIAKQFIIPFESGVVVIRHWKVHNTIRKDRYTPSILPERIQIEEDNNKIYQLSPTVATVGIPSGCHLVGIEKNRIEKIRVEQSSLLSTPSEGADERFEKFWEVYPKKIGKGAALKAFKKIKPSAELLQTMVNAVETQKQSQQWTKDNGQFIPNPATWLNQERWNDQLEVKNDAVIENPYAGIDLGGYSF